MAAARRALFARVDRVARFERVERVEGFARLARFRIARFERSERVERLALDRPLLLLGPLDGSSDASRVATFFKLLFRPRPVVS